MAARSSRPCRLNKAHQLHQNGLSAALGKRKQLLNKEHFMPLGGGAWLCHGAVMPADSIAPLFS